MASFDHAKFRAYCNYVEVSLFETLEESLSLKARFIAIQLYAINLYTKLEETNGLSAAQAQMNKKLFEECLEAHKNQLSSKICKNLARQLREQGLSLFGIFHEWYEINNFSSDLRRKIDYIIQHQSIKSIATISDIPSGTLEEIYNVAYSNTRLLKHHVKDKVNTRSTGYTYPFTHQPVKGRSREGTTIFGEMESDSIIGGLGTNFKQERTKHYIMNTIMKYKSDPNKSLKDALPIIGHAIWNYGGTAIAALVGFAGAALLKAGASIGIYNAFNKYPVKSNPVETKTAEELNKINQEATKHGWGGWWKELVAAIGRGKSKSKAGSRRAGINRRNTYRRKIQEYDPESEAELDPVLQPKQYPEDNNKPLESKKSQPKPLESKKSPPKQYPIKENYNEPLGSDFEAGGFQFSRAAQHNLSHALITSP